MISTLKLLYYKYSKLSHLLKSRDLAYTNREYHVSLLMFLDSFSGKCLFRNNILSSFANSSKNSSVTVVEYILNINIISINSCLKLPIFFHRKQVNYFIWCSRDDNLLTTKAKTSCKGLWRNLVLISSYMAPSSKAFSEKF